MNCKPVKFENGGGFICGSFGKCFHCRRRSELLCDYPIRRYKSGKRKGEWKTCDRKLCRNCTQQGSSGKTDFCREHFPKAKAAAERRKARRI